MADIMIMLNSLLHGDDLMKIIFYHPSDNMYSVNCISDLHTNIKFNQFKFFSSFIILDMDMLDIVVYLVFSGIGKTFSCMSIFTTFNFKYHKNIFMQYF